MAGGQFSSLRVLNGFWTESFDNITHPSHLRALLFIFLYVVSAEFVVKTKNRRRLA